MITLKTLAQASAQEVFDQVATHLLTQKERSYQEREDSKEASKCYYRYNGLKCAAGCLIADDEYSFAMDLPDAQTGLGTGWFDLEIKGVIPRTQHSGLIADLQDLHDHELVGFWESKLQELAVAHSLDFKCKEM
jgi:hypothetical protein